MNENLVGKITGNERKYPTPLEKQGVGDPRGESRTYTTLPEWYIVYSAQEYADFVQSGHLPSEFPFFAAIGQFWKTAQIATHEVGGKGYVDSTTETILRTIGASFSLEYGILGLYENTIGWASELLAFNTKSTEDIYADTIADEYGAFLTHTPWYAFAYTQALTGLWAQYSWSSLWIRGIERRIAFSVGYGVKALYGGLLGYLSQSSFGSANLETTIRVRGIDARTLSAIPGVSDAQELSLDVAIATLPRYRAFRDPALAIVHAGGVFESIQNNTTILLTFVSNTNTSCSGVTEKTLFSMPFVTNETFSRFGISTPVSELHHIIIDLEMCGLSVEHIYDY